MEIWNSLLPLFIVSGRNYSGREQYIFPAFLLLTVRQGPMFPRLTLNTGSSHFYLPNARTLSTPQHPGLCGEGSHGFGCSKQAVFHLRHIPRPSPTHSLNEHWFMLIWATGFTEPQYHDEKTNKQTNLESQRLAVLCSFHHVLHPGNCPESRGDNDR